MTTNTKMGPIASAVQVSIDLATDDAQVDQWKLFIRPDNLRRGFFRNPSESQESAIMYLGMRAGINLRTLRCCCCGGYFRGRQYWNQDDGHGMGDCCVTYAHRNMTDEQFEWTYGKAGIHYNVLSATD
jgi:hypothetical protein